MFTSICPADLCLSKQKKIALGHAKLHKAKIFALIQKQKKTIKEMLTDVVTPAV